MQEIMAFKLIVLKAGREVNDSVEGGTCMWFFKVVNVSACFSFFFPVSTGKEENYYYQLLFW